jgi:hypothetical protein
MAVSKLQLTTQKYHSGLVQSKHLAEMYQTQPEQIDSLVTFMFGKYEQRTPLLYLTSGMKRSASMELGNQEYRWKLAGRHKKAINIVEPVNVGVTPGLDFTEFKVVVEDKWFVKGDVLVADDREYRMRVQSEPRQVANGYELTLMLETGDPTFFCDPAQLESPHKLSKEYNSVGEFSDGGSITFAAGFTMRNMMTTIAKQASISRKAATDNINAVIEAIDSDGKTKKVVTWCTMIEWEFMRQFMEEKEKSLVYSKYNATPNGTVKMMDTNGTPVYTGAGIREQISPSSKRFYTTLTEKLIRDFLVDIISQPETEGGRNLVAFTGTRGFDEFDKAMKDSIKGWQLVNGSTFISGSGSELTLGGQFRTYIGLNDTKLTLRRLPCYDDAEENRTLHFQTGAPLESYRFTILDFGYNGTNSNVKLVHKKGSEMIYFPVEGSVGINGVTAKDFSRSRGTTKDGVLIQGFSECGVMIQDPTNCGELICTAAK